jgi:pentatricopeptide repeat protein
MLTKEQRQNNKNSILLNFKVVYQRKGDDDTREGYINAHEEEEAMTMFKQMLEHQGIEADIHSIKEEEEY